MVGDAPSALGYSWALGPGLGDLVISSGTGLGFGSSRASLATVTVAVAFVRGFFNAEHALLEGADLGLVVDWSGHGRHSVRTRLDTKKAHKESEHEHKQCTKVAHHWPTTWKKGKKMFEHNT